MKLEILPCKEVSIVPMDSGKNSHKALLANYFGDILCDPFELTNSAARVKMSRTILKCISSSIAAQKVIVVLESTGYYHENLYRNLIDLGYDVAMVNPTSFYAQRWGQLNWCESDGTDLSALGQVLIDNQTTETHLPEDLYYNLKQLNLTHFTTFFLNLLGMRKR